MTRLDNIIDKGVAYLKDDPAKNRFQRDIPDDVQVHVPPQEQRTQINTGMRVLFVKPGCNVCKVWKQVVEEANIYLPPAGRIRLIDAYSKHPLLNNLGIRSFPTMIIDGIWVTTASTEAGSAAWLKGLLEDEFRYGGIDPNDYI